MSTLQPPAYCVAELQIRDASAAQRYHRDVQPVMAAYGGHILATSLHNGRVIEGTAGGSVLALHRWESQAAFDAFFAAPEYQPLMRLRHAACTTRLVIFDAAPAPIPSDAE